MDPPSHSFYRRLTSDSWLIFPATTLIEKNFQGLQQDDQKIVDHFGKTIGFGFNTVVYNQQTTDDNKFKAIRIYNQPITQKEFAFIQQLNKNGPQVGILKPTKAFFPAINELNIPAMLIMSKYTTSLAELVEKGQLTESEVALALKQIASGMKFLKENSIFHGDINLRNILYKNSEDGNRYDIADFENSLDFSRFTTLLEFQQAMAERPAIIDYFETLSLTKLSDAEAAARYRELLLSHDAVSFGFLITELSDLLPNLSINPELNRLAEHIKTTRSIEGLMEKLDFKV